MKEAIFSLRDFFKVKHLIPIFALLILFATKDLIETNILYSLIPVTLLQGAVHGGILTAYFLMSFIP